MDVSAAAFTDPNYDRDQTSLSSITDLLSFRPEPYSPPSDDPRGGASSSSNPDVSFRGEKRSNVTHRSVTDPDARLAKKSHNTGAMLCYQASVVTENRHGLIVQTDVRSPAYEAERDAALEMLTMLEPGGRRPRRSRTLGADKGYDTDDFVNGVRALGFTPHVSPNVHGQRHRSAIDGRTIRHPGFAISQRKRKLVEEGFGWGKVVGVLRKLHHRGRGLVGWIFTFTSAAYNRVRLRRLLEPIASP